MWKKILVLVIFFYFLALFQTSFLAHFSIFGFVPNLIFIIVILWNFFEKPKKTLGIFSALIGGFFLDVFSSRPIGFYIFILGAMSLFIKLIIKRYVRIPFIEKA